MNSFRRFLTVILLGSLVTITLYWHLYDIVFSVIAYHVVMVSTGLVTIIALGCVLQSIKAESLFFSLFYALMWFGFLCTILLTYLLAFSGEEILNVPITFSMFWAYTSHFTSTIRTFGSSPLLIESLGAVLLVSLLVFCIAQHRKWWTATTQLAVALRGLPRFLMQRLATTFWARLGFGLFTALLLSLLVYKLQVLSLAGRLQRVHEPFFNVFYERQLGLNSLKGTAEPPNVRANYPKNRSFDRKNVVLILVDALRADYLPIYGYPQPLTPFLSKLAATGRLHKVDYAFSASTSSFPGILSILRSKSWPNIPVKSFALQDLLKDQGYQTHFVLSGDHVNFFDVKSLFGKSVDTYFDGTNSSLHYLNDDRLVLEGLEKIKPRLSKPAFYYFHLMSVHSLGLRHPANTRFLPADAMETDQTHYQNNYKNGIIQADQFIRSLFNKLRERGELANSLVVIMADHGESLGEEGVYVHNNDVTNRETRIPLLIYDPDSTRVYRSDHAIQADMAATVVDRLGLPIPQSWEGESLLKDSHRRFSYHCKGSSYAVINYHDGDIIKYFYSTTSRQEKVFDLKADPYERHNCIATVNKSLLTDFRRRATLFIATTKGRTTVGDP